MPAGSYNINIEQGATWRTKIVATDSDSVLIDLTGWDIRSQFRATVPDTTVLYSFTLGAGNVYLETDPSTTGKGIFYLLITDTESDAFAWTQAVYDLELESPTGDVIRLLKGTVSVSPEVTR